MTNLDDPSSTPEQLIASLEAQFAAMKAADPQSTIPEEARKALEEVRRALKDSRAGEITQMRAGDSAGGLVGLSVKRMPDPDNPSGGAA